MLYAGHNNSVTSTHNLPGSISHLAISVSQNHIKLLLVIKRFSFSVFLASIVQGNFSINLKSLQSKSYNNHENQLAPSSVIPESLLFTLQKINQLFNKFTSSNNFLSINISQSETIKIQVFQFDLYV